MRYTLSTSIDDNNNNNNNNNKKQETIKQRSKNLGTG